MFTGIVEALGVVESIQRVELDAGAGRAPGGGHRPRRRGAADRREHRGRRRLPDRRRARGRALRRRPRPRDAGADHAGRARAGRAGSTWNARCASATRWAATWWPATSTAWARSCRDAARGRGARARDRGPGRPGALPGAQGLDRRRRRQPDHQHCRRATVFSVTLIPHTLAVTKLGAKRVGDAGEPGGRPDREAHRSPGGRAARRRARRRQPHAAPRNLDRHVAEVRLCPLTRHERHAAVARAIDAIRAGGMVILVDDEDRENEGDLTMAADLVTPEAINFMAREGRGLICLSLTEEQVAQLGLPMMAADNRSPRHTAFTVSIDAPARHHHRHLGARAGRDRSAPRSRATPRPDDLVTPGHIFPLQGAAGRGAGPLRPHRGLGRSRPPGRARAGRGDLRDHARGRRDGAHARPARRSRAPHGLPIVTIADLIELPAGARDAGPPGGGDDGAAARSGGVTQRVPRLRLHDRRRGDRVPGAGAGRRPRPTSRCWSACRAPTCCATCSGWAPPRTTIRRPWLRMIEEDGRGV